MNNNERTSNRNNRAEVAQTERTTMRQRPNIEATSDRLVVPQWIRDAYPTCQFFWENDEKGAVQMREARGWAIVRDDMTDGKYLTDSERKYTGSVVSIPVGPGVTTGNLQAVLMMMPKEWYEEDLKAQEAQKREVAKSLRRESAYFGQVRDDGTYDPKLPNGQIGFNQTLGGK